MGVRVPPGRPLNNLIGVNMISWIKRQARKYEKFQWAEPVTRRQCIEHAREAYMMRNIMMQD